MEYKILNTVDKLAIANNIASNGLVLENRLYIEILKVYYYIREMTNVDLSQFEYENGGHNIVECYDYLTTPKDGKDSLYGQLLKSRKCAKQIVDLNKMIDGRYQQLYQEHLYQKYAGQALKDEIVDVIKGVADSISETVKKFDPEMLQQLTKQATDSVGVLSKISAKNREEILKVMR